MNATAVIVGADGEPVPHAYCIRCRGVVLGGTWDTLPDALDQHAAAARCDHRTTVARYHAAGFTRYIPWNPGTVVGSRNDTAYQWLLMLVERAGARVIETPGPIDDADLADPAVWAFEGPLDTTSASGVGRWTWIRRDVLDVWRALAPHTRSPRDGLLPLALRGQEYVWEEYVPARVEAYGALLADPELRKRIAFLVNAGGGEAGLAWLEAL